MNSKQKSQLELAKQLDRFEIYQELLAEGIKPIQLVKPLNRSKATISKALDGQRPLCLLRIRKYLDRRKARKLNNKSSNK